MSIDEQIYQKVRQLSDKQQAEVLGFILSLEVSSANGSKASLMGALSHLGAQLSEDDVAEVRREMWRTLPRDI